MPTLRAGAYKNPITPVEPVFLAGFEQNRRSIGIHDDLYARCLVLERGGLEIRLISLDLIGLFNEDVREIRARSSSENTIVACTHVHSGPDTLGLWGSSFDVSGVDQDYMIFLKTRILECVEKAISRVREARVSFGTVSAHGISKNARDPKRLDNDLVAARIEDEKGSTIATLINFACHPEVLGNENTLVTSDFPGFACNFVEQELGGCAIYLNGALGGMVTPDVQEGSFEMAERIGHMVGQKAIEAIDRAESQDEARLSLRRSAVRIPLENREFLELRRIGVLQREDSDGHLMTDVTVAQVASAEFVTIPGEAFPNLGLELKKKIGARHKFILGIAEDELGYIMQESDFGLELYRYEQSMSVGPKTWPLLIESLTKLI